MRWEGEGKGGGADRASVESEFMRGMRSEREPGEKKKKGEGDGVDVLLSGCL